MHRLTKKHVKRLARAIGSAVMPHGSREALAEAFAEVLGETTPKDRAGNLKPEGAFTARREAEFMARAVPDSGVEIVVSVVVGPDGEVSESWALWVWHPGWGVVVREPEEDSFAGVMALAWKEEFCRNPAAIPVRVRQL